MTALTPVVLACAILAISGGICGVVLARAIWAQDLEHAQRIDEIRSRTQGHMEQQIKILKRRLGEGE